MIPGYSHHYLECDCSTIDHLLRITLSEPTREDPDDVDLYTEVQLNSYHPWYQRIWLAIRYVFNDAPKYGHWDCFLFNKETALAVRELIDRYLEHHERIHNKQK